MLSMKRSLTSHLCALIFWPVSQVALNCLNVAAMEALGGRGAAEQEPGADIELTGEGYEEMPALGVDNSASFVENSASFIDNSASFVMPQDSKVEAIPYNESSIISNEDGSKFKS